MTLQKWADNRVQNGYGNGFSRTIQEKQADQRTVGGDRLEQGE